MFDSAVEFYERHRSGYPVELLDLLVERLGLTRSDLVLDIGCGTGQIAIPLARRVGRVIAVDPVTGMLERGRAAAHSAGVSNIDWRRADSAALTRLGVSGVRLAVFAASFHWTDRAAVLADLDRLLETDGTVVVIADALESDPEWARAIADIRTRYLGPRPRFDGPDHRSVLEASAFSVVDRVSWSWDRELTVDEVVGLQFSYSFSTPALLGDRAEAFAADVRAAVSDLHPSGVVVEPLAVEVLIGRRSAASRTGAEQSAGGGRTP